MEGPKINFHLESQQKTILDHSAHHAAAASALTVVHEKNDVGRVMTLLVDVFVLGTAALGIADAVLLAAGGEMADVVQQRAGAFEKLDFGEVIVAAHDVTAAVASTPADYASDVVVN